MDSVILTVKDEQSGKEYDMELPIDVPGAELCKKLLSTLKNIEGEAFHTVESIVLRYGQGSKQLGVEQTLEDAEIWDGDILTIVKQHQ